jgi:hypothetical protein
LTKLVIERPLGKLDLGDQYGLDPAATFHDRRRDPLAPTSSTFLGQVDKGQVEVLSFCNCT